jgi:hypothetical protein
MAKTSKKKVEKVRLYGKFINFDKKKHTNYFQFKPYSFLPVYITQNETLEEGRDTYAAYKILIEDDGSFDFRLKIDGPGYFIVLATNNFRAVKCIPIYIKSKTSEIKMDIDFEAKTPYLKINFESKTDGTKINAYLQKKRPIDGYNDDEKVEVERLPTKEYMNRMLNWKKESKTLLKNSGIKDKYFLKLEPKKIYYKYYGSLAGYFYSSKSNYFVAKKDKAPLWPILKKSYENFDFDDLMLYSTSHAYRMQHHMAVHYACRKKYMADNNLTESFFKKNPNAYCKSDEKHWPIFLSMLNEKTTNEAIKNKEMTQFIFAALLCAKTKEDFAKIKESYNLVQKFLTSEHFKKELKKMYEDKLLKLSGLEKGRFLPKFNNYKNYKGGTTSLADFKGKYVFICLWAPS